MKKIVLVLTTLTLFSLGVSVVYADVPSVTSLMTEIVTDGRTLTITVRHNSPSSIHYVSKLEVKIGENVETVELNPQTTTAFTEEYSIPASGSVEVKAYCTLHGWSSWVTLQEGTAEPPADGPSGGIPGFPAVSLGIGLACLALLHRRH